jgi:hypothetical protein
MQLLLWNRYHIFVNNRYNMEMANTGSGFYCPSQFLSLGSWLFAFAMSKKALSY